MCNDAGNRSIEGGAGGGGGNTGRTAAEGEFYNAPDGNPGQAIHREIDTCEQSHYNVTDEYCCPNCNHSHFATLDEIDKVLDFQNTSLFKPCCPGHGYLHHDEDCSVITTIAY